MRTVSKALVGEGLSDPSNFAAVAIAAGTRVRKSPFFPAAISAGLRAGTVYNRMILPTSFTSPEEEYWALKDDVQIWDVGAERQVEIVGPDAAMLVNRMTPRDLTKMKVGDCKYALLTDRKGIVYNDPVCLKLAEDRFWLSLADSDAALFAEGLAAGLGADVDVFEPDVSPLAVQGPKAPLVIADVFGDWIHDLPYFGFKQTDINGIPVLLARSGWSPEKGYELYLQDGTRGEELWNLVFEAGQKYNMSVGAVNNARRIEAGMLSWGGDITHDTNALELGLPKFMVNLKQKEDFIGRAALEKIAAEGSPKRKFVPITIDGPPAAVVQTGYWQLTAASGADAGVVTASAWSPGLEQMIGLALVQSEEAEPGTALTVEVGDEMRTAHVTTLPIPGSTINSRGDTRPGRGEDDQMAWQPS